MAIGERRPVASRKRVYRNPANQRLVLGILLFGVALLGGGALEEPAPGTSRGTYIAFCALLTVIFVGLGYWRCYRAGLYPREVEAIVVNVFWTYRMPWSEIESFSVGPSMYEYRVVHLERANEVPIPITGTAGWAPFMGKRLARAPDSIADELNALLRERRGDTNMAVPEDSPGLS
jgi:hypothetical protein